jgi:hypothetical protein
MQTSKTYTSLNGKPFLTRGSMSVAGGTNVTLGKAPFLRKVPLTKAPASINLHATMPAAKMPRAKKAAKVLAAPPLAKVSAAVSLLKVTAAPLAKVPAAAPVAKIPAAPSSVPAAPLAVKEVPVVPVVLGT